MLLLLPKEERKERYTKRAREATATNDLLSNHYMDRETEEEGTQKANLYTLLVTIKGQMAAAAAAAGPQRGLINDVSRHN